MEIVSLHYAKVSSCMAMPTNEDITGLTCERGLLMDGLKEALSSPAPLSRVTQIEGSQAVWPSGNNVGYILKEDTMFNSQPMAVAVGGIIVAVVSHGHAFIVYITERKPLVGVRTTTYGLSIVDSNKEETAHYKAGGVNKA